MVFFFFFQAEDGIRDWSVTGVQTCALPICPGHQSRCAECPLADRSPQHRDLHLETGEDRAECDPTRPVPPPRCADMASPNPTRNVLGKGPSQTPAPEADRKSVV